MRPCWSSRTSVTSTWTAPTRSPPAPHGSIDYLTACATRIDCVVVTGDIADHGTYDEYEEATSGAAPCLPGDVLPRQPRRTPRHAVEPARRDRRRHRIRIADGCDQSEPRHQRRHVRHVRLIDPRPQRRAPRRRTLKWLDEALGRATGPAFVCFHHPPVRLHQPFVDAIKLPARNTTSPTSSPGTTMSSRSSAAMLTPRRRPRSPAYPCWSRPASSPRCCCPGRATRSSPWTCRRRWRSTSSTTTGG